MAILLTILMPGMGHLYLGTQVKGIVFLIIYVVGFSLGIKLLAIAMLLIFYPYSIYDAVETCRKINARFKLDIDETCC